MRRVLDEARRPLILYGGCNWLCAGTKALQSFAEGSDIPVVSVFRYQDQVDKGWIFFCGETSVGMTPAVRKLIMEADVILAVNHRLGENSTDGWTLLNVPVPQQRLIHVHASDLELGKVYQPELGIPCCLDAFVQALAVDPVKGDWAAWRADARAAWEAGFELGDLPGPVDMGKVTAHLQDVLPADAILTNGAGNFTVWPNKLFRFGPEARLLAPQSGAMGHGVPAAIAAKVADPVRTVVCFAGDGDFQMNCQELATASQFGAQPIILILRNGIYGTIRAHQERNYPARVSGTDMDINPDFVTLAKACGFHAEEVETTDGFAVAFHRALASRTGAMLELTISPGALTPRVTLSQMRESALKAKETA